MPKSTRVLQRKPGCGEWLHADFPVGPHGFELAAMRAMTGSEFIEGINLGQDFRLICDEEGRLKNLPVSLGIYVTGHGVLPIFGQFAVVRQKAVRLHGGCFIAVGLLPGDEETIRSTFGWSDRLPH